MSKQKTQRFLLETSTLRKAVWGVDKEKEEIKSTTNRGIVFTSNYCIKEIIVGVIKPLISFYFVVKEAKDTDTAVKQFTNEFSNRVPKLLMQIIYDLRFSFTNDRSHDLEIIKMYIDFIFRNISKIPNRGITKETHWCAIAELKVLPTETILKEIYTIIDRLFTKRQFHDCKIEKFLSINKTSLDSFTKSSLSKKSNGFKIIHSSFQKIKIIDKCSICSKIADLIIAHEDLKSTIITYDKSINEISDVISRKCILLNNHSALQYHQALKKIIS